MLNSSSCMLRLGAAATLVAALGVTGCHRSSNHSAPAPAVVVPPTVSAITPASGAVGVANNSSISVTFSEAMNPATITPVTFSVGGLSGGTVSYSAASRIATYAPASSLANSTTFTVTITTGVQNPAGLALAAAFVWNFTTGATPDTTPPTVIAMTPLSGATGVPVNVALTAAFDEAMMPVSLDATSFTLQQGTNVVAGTVTYADAGRIATLAPASALAASTTYTATVTTAAQDLAGNFLASSVVWSFTTGTTADTTPPTVTAVSPGPGATGVAVNTKVNATFSESMDPATVTTASFTLSGPGATAVTGTIAYVDLTGIATFKPASALAANTTFTARLTSGVRDLAGNALANAFVWTFTTAVTPDATPPTVLSTIPAAAATGVATNSVLTATFSESMDPATIASATYTLSITAGAAVTGAVSYVDAGRAARFVPNSVLLASTGYTATLTIGVKDSSGNPLAAVYTWTFTTGAVTDTTLPTVTATNPADTAISVVLNKKVNATFSESMDPATLTTATFTLAGPGGASVVGTIAYDTASQIATLSPLANLAANTLYTATLTTGVMDAARNALAANHVWSFTTAANAAQAPVALRSAAPYAVLAGSTVTNSNGTTVNGDLGVSAGTSVTGFPPGVVNGSINAGNSAAAQAQLDLTTAYNDAKGRTTNAISLPGNLGGLTLTPGLYANSSSTGISGTGANGILTLNAQGDPSAVFIFQMASTLTTDSSTSIVLSGGAKAANIFWQVGSSATLGTSSIFYGTILADQSIALTTGVTLTGRALARIGGVTLDSNTVTVPSP